MQPPRTTREDFEFWLASMDDALGELFARVPKPLAARLDFSPESLDALEGWLLDRFPSLEATEPRSAAQELDQAARYVGETYRRSLGGRWDIELEDEGYAYFGRPQLVGLSDPDTPESPLALVTTAVDRRSGHFLRSLLEHKKERRG